MSLIKGYNCSQEEASVCDVCEKTMNASYVNQTLHDYLGPQRVSSQTIKEMFIDYRYTEIIFIGNEWV